MEAGCLDESMAASPDGWALQLKCILSFRLFPFIWQSRYWRIFTLVLVLMEHPSGISAGLSKTLEMVLGLLRSSLTPSDLALGSGIPLITSAHIQAAPVWAAAEAPLKMTFGGLGGGGGFSGMSGGVQRHLGRRMRSGPPLVAVTRAVKGWYTVWWSLLFIVQRGFTQHVSNSPLTLRGVDTCDSQL